MADDLYWVVGPWPGRLAITARPRGGDWLAADIDRWRRVGIDVIASLLTRDELGELNLQQERQQVEKAGLHFITFPIPDRSIPVSLWETRQFIEQLHGLLVAGKVVGIHCRQSVGRSALLAASLLVQAGVDADTAFGHVEAARGCAVPETAEQREWVERFAELATVPVL